MAQDFNFIVLKLVKRQQQINPVYRRTVRIVLQALLRITRHGVQHG